MPVTIKEAGPVARFIVARFGFCGITAPWSTVYIAPGWMHDATLMRHEIAHLGQMRRDGWLRFWVMICVWFVYPGYARSPYEIEARLAENDINHPLVAWADHWSTRC